MSSSANARSVIAELVAGFMIPGKPCLNFLRSNTSVFWAQSVFLLRQSNRDDDVRSFSICCCLAGYLSPNSQIQGGISVLRLEAYIERCYRPMDI
jgi:hypothetical protein